MCPPLFNCKAALSALGAQRSAALFATGRGTRERRGITCPNHCGSATVSPNVRLVVIRSARAPLPLLLCQPSALRHGTQHLRQHFHIYTARASNVSDCLAATRSIERFDVSVNRNFSRSLGEPVEKLAPRMCLARRVLYSWPPPVVQDSSAVFTSPCGGL